jgi:hypothetical protein
MLTTPNTDPGFNFNAYLADINKEDWPDALDFYSVTAHTCWHCGGANHYARNCPNKSQFQPQSRAIGTLVGTIYGQLPSGFQVSSAQFPNLSQRRVPPIPTNNQQQAQCLANHYRPRYSQALLARPGD